MKAFFLMTLAMTLAQTAVASSQPKCPAGSKTVLKCKAADQRSDQEVALSFMDGAVICEDSLGAHGMIMSLPESNVPSELIPVQRILRAGATAFTATAGDTQFSLNRLVIMGKVNATFTISMAGMQASRSLSCK